MSTYYQFVCHKCKMSGGHYTRQMWGWGNADIIDSFQFLMKHSECGEEGGNELGIYSEHDYYYGEYEKDTSPDLNNYFPHSNEWNKEVSDERFNAYMDQKRGFIEGEVVEPAKLLIDKIEESK